MYTCCTLKKKKTLGILYLFLHSICCNIMYHVTSRKHHYKLLKKWKWKRSFKVIRENNVYFKDARSDPGLCQEPMDDLLRIAVVKVYNILMYRNNPCWKNFVKAEAMVALLHYQHLAWPSQSLTSDCYANRTIDWFLTPTWKYFITSCMQK